MFLQDQVQGQGGSDSFKRQGEEEDNPDFNDQEGLNGSSSTMRGRESSTFGDRGLIYQVHVLGEVKRPGTYRVSPSMRATDALQMAGNIKSNGSERFVEFRRPGQTHGLIIDLFAYKTLGQLSQNPYLQDNTTIFVPLKKRAVEVEGPVHRPGIFELRGEQDLNDMITLAGGFTVGLDQRVGIKVVRYRGYEDKEVFEIPSTVSEMKGFHVEDGDVIVVPHKFLSKHEFDYNLKKLPNDNIFYPAYETRVFVIGAVRVPGAFDFNQYYTLRQYLTLAGGTTTMAKNGQIKVVTVDGKTFKAKNGNYAGIVNPGDTIIVPEKSIPTSFWIGLLPTIASLGLSSVAIFHH